MEISKRKEKSGWFSYLTFNYGFKNWTRSAGLIENRPSIRSQKNLSKLVKNRVELKTRRQIQFYPWFSFKNHTSNSKGMFGNCFFPLFSVFKNNFLFLKLKNLFGNSKRAENKNCFQNSICEGNWKHAKGCFQFLIFKSQWKHAFNLMNLSHLMS